MAYPKLSRRKLQWPEQWLQPAVPELPVETRLPDGADEPQGPHTPKLTVRQNKGSYFNELDLSGLESWPPELADSTQWLLAKYHGCLFIGTY